ncbi:MAG: hypothetical protein LBF15_00300 [Candidatus Peribacteria bacterium]|jgi:8-oxo-dGTP diphosphatase|nr:hypothetical protein [Candidatus Peribacteria bacterium]
MELIDILDDNGDFTGEIEEYELIHSLGKWHRTAHIWIINSKNELLIQKRSAMKKSNPNKWDISGAGHIGS